MGDRGKRIRLATGIYQDRYGITVRVRDRWPRYPIGTPLATLRQARKDLQEEVSAKTGARHGTLAVWFDEYLNMFPPGPRRRDEAALLEHWREAGVDQHAPDAVTPLEIRQQLAAWAHRFAPATRNHLRRVLGAVYRAVNGKSGFNPVRDVPKLPVHYEEPRAIPYDLIEFIFARMPDLGRAVKGTAKKAGGPGRSTVNKTKIRLRVMAYTGLPPAQLGRVQPRDLSLRTKEMFARPRRKGAGVEGYRLPLADQAVAELRAFVQHQCFGPFNARSAAYTWRRAVTRAKTDWQKTHKAAWPLAEDVRAYDLRHSFATAVLLETGDLEATANLLMHASLTTTKRYTKAAVSQRMRLAAAKLQQHWTATGSHKGSQFSAERGKKSQFRPSKGV